MSLRERVEVKTTTKLEQAADKKKVMMKSWKISDVGNTFRANISKNLTKIQKVVAPGIQARLLRI